MKITTRFIRYATLAFVLFVAAPMIVSAQPNRSSISGFVFDKGRNPIANIYVELRSEYSTVGRVRTDGSGKFYFPGLPQGRFEIIVRPFGTDFEEQSVEVEIAGIGVRGQALADHVQRDIYLRPRKGASAPMGRASVVYAQQVPAQAESLYKSAVSDIESQRLDEGIAGLEKAIEAFPTYFAALERLGRAYLDKKRYDDATSMFDRAIKVNSRCYDCWFSIAQAKYAERKFTEAIEAGEKAQAEGAEYTETKLLVGTAYRLTKNFEKAEEALKAANKSADGRSSDAHWQLALLYGKDQQRYAEAAKELEAYLKLEPEATNKNEIKNLIKQFKDKAKAGN